MFKKIKGAWLPGINLCLLANLTLAIVVACGLMDPAVMTHAGVFNVSNFLRGESRSKPTGGRKARRGEGYLKMIAPPPLRITEKQIAIDRHTLITPSALIEDEVKEELPAPPLIPDELIAPPVPAQNVLTEPKEATPTETAVIEEAEAPPPASVDLLINEPLNEETDIISVDDLLIYFEKEVGDGNNKETVGVPFSIPNASGGRSIDSVRSKAVYRRE